jgi:hypothetical protein
MRVDCVEHRVLLSGEAADESNAQFSPDGRWVAYTSDGEVYVMPFPPTGGKRQVSLDGGSGARWSGATGELFFWKGDTLMVTRVVTDRQSFQREIPRALFVLPGRVADDDVTPDGQRFVVKVRNPDARVHEIHVIRNWFEVLKERAEDTQ